MKGAAPVRFEKICVLGLGYIGLPTASTFATHGLEVIGVDVDERVVEILRNGEIHIHEPGLRTLVQAAFRSGNLHISDHPGEADAFIIAVPTPIRADKSADMCAVTSAARSIVPVLKTGNLVVLESTSPPRTTVDLVAPILENSGLIAGEDFQLAYSPERVLPGKILTEIIENARVIGGVNRLSAEAGRDLYATFVRGDIILTTATTAEMVKLMENTYRDVNIAIANEFAGLAETFGVDIWEAIQTANLHPRVDILKPGPGVGGHCISVDPWFFVETAPDQTQLIRQARMVNDHQPMRVVNRLEGVAGKLDGLRVAVLGLAYKPDVDDLRESPAIKIVHELLKKGAEVCTFEPYAKGTSVGDAGHAESLEDALNDADVLMQLVNHSEFKSLDPARAAVLMRGDLVFDTRGIWERAAWELAGMRFIRLGDGSKHA
ncbi:MAG: nucleotide sugar dehydrogenase [Anaerolineales bacterium]|nr:nucleotide sugar dehydrogenase [Anaerolineales bacterium]